ncbi:MAG TPA: hypothetical protein PK286_12650 [Devosia sp.]|nr:hypothetical protein [Devosia sp.]
MTTPYDTTNAAIGVTIVTSDAAIPQSGDVAVIRLEPSLHQHAAGSECVACAARGDVRAMLFDLLASARAGFRQPFTSVVIDASRLANPQPVIDRLSPQSPAVGMRDFTVAKSFRLTGVI